MLSEKAYALCLLEILQEHSDAEHILPMREIIAKMQVIYGIRPDRRTIYAAAALLIGLGYDLSVYEENGVGYYLRSRPLEQSEVLLLTDAVYAFPFISARQTEQLVKKLTAGKKEKPSPAGLTVDYAQEAARDLGNTLGRGCRIVSGKKKGRIELEYYGVDDLNELLEALHTIKKP